MNWHIVRVEAKGNPMGMIRDVLMVRVRSIHRPATEEAVQSEEFDCGGSGGCV